MCVCVHGNKGAQSVPILVSQGRFLGLSEGISDRRTSHPDPINESSGVGAQERYLRSSDF